jgi:flagellar motility protein MotE (MotC chaperone)
MFLSLILVHLAYKQAIFTVPPPIGLFKPDYATCSERDRDTYQGTFPGYLYLTKNEFSVSILDGTWKKVGKRVLGRTEYFMERNLHRKPGDEDRDSFLGGLVFEVASNGDLLLVPGKGQYQKSKLRFRRLPEIRIVDALKQSSEIDLDLRVMNSTTNWPYHMLLWNEKSKFQKTFFEVVKSSEPLAIRTAAARCLEGNSDEAVIKEVGDMFLKLPTTKEKGPAIFRRRLLNVLTDSRLPCSFDIAMKALDAKLISNNTASRIAGKSRNPVGIDFILKLAESAKPEEIASLIEDMRQLDRKAAVALAKRCEESSDLDAQFQATRTLAECEALAHDRNKSVTKLFELFSNVDWMKQCDIARALGNAQTPLALTCLKKISGKGSDEAVQQWIDEAIGKYKAK